MTLSVAVAVVDNYVTITATGGTAPYTATAAPAGRDEYPTRGAWVLSGADYVSADGDVPFGVATTWTVRDSLGASLESSVLTVTPAATPILSDATDPAVWIAAQVISQKPNTWEARTKWWDVLGTSDPFVSIAPMRKRSGDLVLYVPVTERATVIAMLQPGNPLLLRSPDDHIDDLFMAITTVGEDLVNTDAPTEASRFTLTYQNVARDLGVYAGDITRTYADLAAEAADYVAVQLMYLDYRGVRTGERR